MNFKQTWQISNKATPVRYFFLILTLSCVCYRCEGHESGRGGPRDAGGGRRRHGDGTVAAGAAAAVRGPRHVPAGRAGRLGAGCTLAASAAAGHGLEGAQLHVRPAVQSPRRLLRRCAFARAHPKGTIVSHVQCVFSYVCISVAIANENRFTVHAKRVILPPAGGAIMLEIPPLRASNKITHTSLFLMTASNVQSPHV